jgi:hypothetical protein
MSAFRTRRRGLAWTDRLCELFAPTMGMIVVMTIVLGGTAAPGQEMRAPQVRSVSVDWQSLNLPEPKISEYITRVFPNIADSPIPVLLPFDVEALSRDLKQGGAKPTSAYLGGFSVSKVFVPGPSGYDAAFSLDISRAPVLKNLGYNRKVEIQISGSFITYELAASENLISGEPGPAEFRDKFPGLREIQVDQYLRYTFLRYKVPYVLSVECVRDKGEKGLSCKKAEKILNYALSLLQVVGGNPNLKQQRATAPVPDRPPNTSKYFTYYRSGNLLDGTGSGRADYTVYANIIFPIAGPAFANSQLYMNGGDCYGQVKDLPKGSEYHCSVNETLATRGATISARNAIGPWVNAPAAKVTKGKIFVLVSNGRAPA